MNCKNTLPTTGQDWANHLSHEVSGSGTICFAVALSKKPDIRILHEAAADVITLQPVLGCIFDLSQDPPVWAFACDADWFTQAEVNDLEKGQNAFLQDAMAHGRQMEIRLLSCKEQHVLCVKFDHAATDGGGAKACLALLSDCYNRRCEGEKAPVPSSPDRSDAQVFARCGIADFRMALKREAPPAGPMLTVPFHGTDGQTVLHRFVSLPLHAIRREGITVNDRLLAAYALTLHEKSGNGSPAVIHMTVDLRRYLEEKAVPAACNLSGMESVTAALCPGQTFANTLLDIQAQTARLKSNRPGLGSAAMMAYLRTMPYLKVREMLLDAARKTRQSGIAAPILSNLGFISSEPMRFGDALVTSIVPLLPALHAPAFMLGAFSFGDTLTLSAGFYGEERDAENVEKLLQAIRDRLLKREEA